MSTPTVRETLQGSSTGPGNLTLTLGSVSATSAVGDVLVVCHGSDYYAATGLVAPGGTAVTSWAEIALGDLGTNNSHLKAWVGVVTTAFGTVTVHPVNDEDQLVILLALQGADTTTPVDGAGAGTNDTGAGTIDHVAPQVSPTTADALLVCAVQTQLFKTTDYTAPPGMLERGEVDNQSTLSVATQVLSSAGATGTRTFAADNINYAYVAVSLAVRGPASATPLTLDAQPAGPAPGGTVAAFTIGTTLTAQPAGAGPDGTTAGFTIGTTLTAQPAGPAPDGTSATFTTGITLSAQPAGPTPGGTTAALVLGVPLDLTLTGQPAGAWPGGTVAVFAGMVTAPPLLTGTATVLTLSGTATVLSLSGATALRSLSGTTHLT